MREEFSEALIKEAGKGWSQNMSGYIRAIRACISKASPRPRAVLAVWPEEDGEIIAMRLRSGAGDYMCVAKKDGTQANVRKREPVETVPDAGPILWLGASMPPSWRRCPGRTRIFPSGARRSPRPRSSASPA